MKHQIIDIDTVMLANWLQGLPDAQVCSRMGLSTDCETDVLVRWCRLRAGETVSTILPGLLLSTGRTVVLADEPSEPLILDVLSAGAHGCCNTHAAPEVLQQVATVVENGGLWVGQSLLQQLIGSTARILAKRKSDKAEEVLPNNLSEREKQVALLVAQGASNKEIASRLTISERTVKAHMTAIFDKTGARDRLQLSLKVNGLKL